MRGNDSLLDRMITIANVILIVVAIERTIDAFKRDRRRRESGDSSTRRP